MSQAPLMTSFFYCPCTIVLAPTIKGAVRSIRGADRDLVANKPRTKKETSPRREKSLRFLASFLEAPTNVSNPRRAFNIAPIIKSPKNLARGKFSTPCFGSSRAALGRWNSATRPVGAQFSTVVNFQPHAR